MPTAIQLTPDTKQQINFPMSQTGRSKAFYLRELIERGIEDLEDYYLAIDVLERVLTGTEPVYSATEVRETLKI